MRLVDLFCGCGGLTLGVTEGARRCGLAAEVVLAVDIDPVAVSVFGDNFPSARVVLSDIKELFGGDLRSPLSPREKGLAASVGPVDVLVAGAPCQGHSDLNNHTRRRDPRNRLYLRAVRAALVLRPALVVLENVPAVQHDVGRVVPRAQKALESSGYTVACGVADLGDLGVPQTRKRHLLLASRSGHVDLRIALARSASCAAHLPRSVGWAIKDLEDTAPGTLFDRASIVSPENRRRIRWLFQNRAWDLPNNLRPSCHHGDHSYRAMYGRLRWDRPAHTITSGFGSMGQGRYIHPSRQRTITPHEAARLQTFPDFFSLAAVSSRTALARLIGNAVPPLVALHLIGRLVAGRCGANPHEEGPCPARSARKVLDLMRKGA